jgi:hypothetical protein
MAGRTAASPRTFQTALVRIKQHHNNVLCIGFIVQNRSIERESVQRVVLATVSVAGDCTRPYVGGNVWRDAESRYCLEQAKPTGLWAADITWHYEAAIRIYKHNVTANAGHDVLPTLHQTTVIFIIIMYHAMKTYGKVEVQFHAFLTSAMDGGEQSDSLPGHFTPGERVP